MNKKIYLISQTESHLTQRGKRHPDLANFLCANGYDLEYFSSNFYHAEKIHFTNEQLEEANKTIGYKLHLIKTISYFKNIGIRRIISNIQFSIKVYKNLKKKNLDHSIIIVPSRPVEITYFLSKLKKRTNVEVLVDIRDVWPDAFNIKNKFLKKGFEFYCNFFLKNKVSSFDKFIHTCPQFLDWLTRYSPDAESLFIPLGYDSERFQRLGSHSESDLVDTKINFVYIGLLQYQIDILPFIKAMEKDVRFTLTLYGDNGEGERYNQVISYLSENNIDNVFVKGKLPQDKVGEILCIYDIGLMPMKAKFAFPNKVFDYLAMSLPIFSIGKHDTSIFVSENKIGWVSSFEVDEIKPLLNQISKNDINKFKSEIAGIKTSYSREKLYQLYIKKIKD